jgi:hypothetical protein
MWRILGVSGLLALLVGNVHARVFELRGLGVLPLETEFGVPGEGITISVVLDSDNFFYVPIANPIYHYFEAAQPVPVHIVGGSTGAFADVSPSYRFLALDWDEDFGGDLLSLDVSSGTSSTSLFSLITEGQSGFDCDVTPFTPDQLFDLLEDALSNEALWQATAGAAFLGSPEDILSFGTLDWSIEDISESLPGDFDQDNDVDGRDFLIWQRDTSVGALGDWQAHYGTGSLTADAVAVPDPPLVAVTTAVPEPSAGLLATMSLLCFFRRRGAMVNC